MYETSEPHRKRGVLEAKILKKMYERMVKCFMDVVVLAELRNGSMSGYDIIGFIHRKFHILLSSGTVYSLLYSLEREGLIKGRRNQRKRVYVLTDKGEKTIEAVLNEYEKTLSFMRSLFAKVNRNASIAPPSP